MDQDVFVISVGIRTIGYMTSLDKAIDVAKRSLSNENEKLYEIRKRYNDNNEVDYVLVQSESIPIRIDRVLAI